MEDKLGQGREMQLLDPFLTFFSLIKIGMKSLTIQGLLDRPVYFLSLSYSFESRLSNLGAFSFLFLQQLAGYKYL